MYCPQGDFYVDAWGKVARNIVTHAHSDHARFGAERYLCSRTTEPLMRRRLGQITVDSLAFGESIDLNGVRVSLHPAGHVLGSAQVRIEHRGQVWVASGDYKRERDLTCEPFELVRCNTFITECTFGLPIFIWGDSEKLMADINKWWRDNREVGRTSVLLAYALGKSQRVLANLDPAIGPILLHGAVIPMTTLYGEAGMAMPTFEYANVENAKNHKGKAIVIAPPGALNTTWIRKFAPFSVAVASGWMRVRGIRRRKAADRGFVLSDHVDFPSLLQTIKETGAEHVIATHGYTSVLQRLLSERGLQASTFQTHFGDEDEGTSSPTDAAPQRSDGGSA